MSSMHVANRPGRRLLTAPRRVLGLRWAEVVQLAGFSVEHYSRLERGDMAGVSGGVLDPLGRAPRLGEA